MGGSLSKSSARCESSRPAPMGNQDQFDKDPNFEMEAPPTLQRPMSFEEKLYSKFIKQPLVPIGCLTTAYFLFTGLKAFRNRDVRRSQKMMRARVGAQFATLAAFVSYVGLENVNLEIAPAYYRAKEAEEEYDKHMVQEEKTKGGDSQKAE